MNSNQDWAPVVWKKNAPKATSDAIQRGYNVSALHKISDTVRAQRKLNNEELPPIKRISRSFSRAMQEARLKNKMTQKQLAQHPKINVKPSVINQYESGKAMPDQKIMTNIKTVLGIKGKFR